MNILPLEKFRLYGIMYPCVLLLWFHSPMASQSYRVYHVTTDDGIKLLTEVVMTTITLSSHYSLLVAVAATDSNGDSAALSKVVKMTTHPVLPSQLLPDYIAQDVVIATNPANRQLVLKWKPPLDASKLQV